MASNSGHGISYPGSIVVNVRFTDQQNTYELNKCSTVKELRQRLASDYNAQVSEVKILLGGMILDDCLTIEVFKSERISAVSFNFYDFSYFILAW